MDLWPIPDAVYTVNGEYVKQVTAQTLTNNTDIPVIPDQQLIIVWKALMYYGAFEGAPEVYAHGETQFNNALNKLEYNQLPKITYGPSLL